MTEADRQARKDARQEADDALARAQSMRERGAKIAEGWVKSRKDNNFRLMIRNLGREAPRAS
jgi:hypothetical protein